jgi:transposase
MEYDPSRLRGVAVYEKAEGNFSDSAYESDKLDADLAQQGIELIAPHRRDRKRKTQDGRPLRRYRRRWKVERLFAWLQNYRRIVVRYERHADDFLGMLHLTCCLILLRCL